MVSKRRNPMQIKFDDKGLVPAVVQDIHTGEVLMLAYMNADALERTWQTRESHFWSRRRQELWHKGETSGNIQLVGEIRLDCDQDAVLLKVDPAGPACHTGNHCCFYQRLEEQDGELCLIETVDLISSDEQKPESSDFSLDDLYSVICQRRDHPSESSYTARLLAEGEDEIVKKVGEEAVEVILAAKSQGDQRLIEEVADLAYHVLVLLASHGVTPGDILTELTRRHQK